MWCNVEDVAIDGESHASTTHAHRQGKRCRRADGLARRIFFLSFFLFFGRKSKEILEIYKALVVVVFYGTSVIFSICLPSWDSISPAKKANERKNERKERKEMWWEIIARRCRDKSSARGVDRLKRKSLVVAFGESRDDWTPPLVIIKPFRWNKRDTTPRWYWISEFLHSSRKLRPVSENEKRKRVSPG